MCDLHRRQFLASGALTLGGTLAILLAVGLIAPNSTNVYGGMMTALSIGNNIDGRLLSTRTLRIVVAVAASVLADSSTLAPRAARSEAIASKVVAPSAIAPAS